MRVLMISFVRRGGMVHYISQLSNAVSSFCQVEVLVPDAVNLGLFNESVERYLLSAGRGKWDTLLGLFNPKLFRTIMAEIVEAKPDVIHITSPHPWVLFFLFNSKLRFIYTVHDPMYHSGDSKLKRIPDEFLRRRASAFICHSEQDRANLTRLGFANKLTEVIPLISFDIGSQLSSENGKRQMILFFGRIVDYKGLDILLDASSIIFNNLPEAEIVIAGEGDISKYHKYFNNHKIHFINRYILEEEIPSIFSDSTLVALPYKDATNSAVIPLAYSYGKPVVATTVGSLANYVEDGRTGILIEPNNPKLLAEKIIELIRDPELISQMSINALAYSKNNISPEVIGKKHYDFYQKYLKYVETPSI